MSVTECVTPPDSCTVTGVFSVLMSDGTVNHRATDARSGMNDALSSTITSGSRTCVVPFGEPTGDPMSISPALITYGYVSLEVPS